MQLYANNPTHRSTIHNNNKAFSRSSWCMPIHELRRQTEGLAEAEVSKHKESTSSKSTPPATSVWERSPDIPPSSSRVRAPWQRPPNSPPLSQAGAKCPPPRGAVLNAPLQAMTSWTATSAVQSAAELAELAKHQQNFLHGKVGKARTCDAAENVWAKSGWTDRMECVRINAAVYQEALLTAASEDN